MPSRGVFSLELIEDRAGLLILRALGTKVEEIFGNESGGHRFQRIPPNEKKGRVHTSTITVATLSEPTEVQIQLNSKDLHYQFCRGSGPGGQNRNKTETAVQLTHLPTNLMVRCESERSQEQNKKNALALLRAKLWEARNSQHNNERANERKRQVGSGMRGDKRRTIRYQDGIVTDHLLNKRWSLKSYLRGEW